MLIFYGLGNNEDKYFKTKHNAGRIVLEKIVELAKQNWQKGDGYFFAKDKWGDQDVYFLYSSGYMNTSGSPLSKFIKYYKLDTQAEDFNLIILQDDSDQMQGNQKLVLGGGSAGHNGIQDIYNHSLGMGLSIDKIWRLKIGIRPENNTEKSLTFVLKNMGSKEVKNLESLAGQIVSLKTAFGENNFEKVQNVLNTKD